MSEERVLEGQLVLGRYRILKPLARGGMGIVYLGRVEGAAGFAKPVVVKRVLPHLDEQEESRRQFVREARILSNFQHPAIVGVIDFAEESDAYVMVLEYVHGYHLGHWLRFARESRGNIDWEQAVLVLTSVLSGLHYAHTYKRSGGERLEIIHRDISPSNILVDLEGNVRLLDFGIARTKGDTDEYRTSTGVVKGKLSYIAPELFDAGRPSIKSDIYACGVVLYQLLTGQNPFTGKESGETIRRVLHHVPAPISGIRPEVPVALDAVIARALAKNPTERFANADEFANSLRELLVRPEAAIFKDFKKAVQADFTSDLPAQLGLEPLASLESAWRESSVDIDAVLRSSAPPPPLDGDKTVVGGSPFRTITETAPSPRHLAEQSSPGVSRRTLAVTIVGAGIAAAAASIAAVAALREPAAKEPRFLVVERNSNSNEAAGSAAPPEASAKEEPSTVGSPPPSAVAPAASPSHAPASAPRSAATGKPRSAAEQLSLTFSQRQGAIQSCFNKNAESLEGSPQISVRFQVAATGDVSSASLVPAQMAGTALGQCILAVAKDTHFGAQEAPLGFTIPITARTVRR